jgi:23S rRNA (guanine2445-N2)-methyltransferase / 23S rRNA (guanine2069-N7)-methyltransferase
MSYHFVATTSKGLEPILAQELRAMGVGVDAVGRGVVYFVGKLENGYRACLWSRVASRVILRVARGRVDSPDAIYELAGTVDWSEHLDIDQSLFVDFVGRGKGINNSIFGAQRVKDAIVDNLRTESGARPDVDFEHPDVRVSAHLHRGSMTIGIDLSGTALHRRGKGRLTGTAPIKESLAAAILHMANWPKLAKMGVPLFDPMCGSGTFLSEGLGIAQDRAPGLNRQRWGFSNWKGHDVALWDRLRDEAHVRSKAGKKVSVRLYGRDTDSRVLEAARENLRQAGAGAGLSLERATMSQARAPEGSGKEPEGLFVCNPPYGRRLESEEDAKTLHREMGNVLRRQFLGWTAFIITEHGSMTKSIGLKPAQRIPVFNGPIECRVLEIGISRKKVARDQDSKPV